MGQYHIVVCKELGEFVSPHGLGLGLKLVEQSGAEASMGDALLALLACSNGRGGGDFLAHPVVGRWAGKSVAVVGDYASAEDLDSEWDAEVLFTRAVSNASEWDEMLGHQDTTAATYRRIVDAGPLRDITPAVRDFLALEFGYEYGPSDIGWINRWPVRVGDPQELIYRFVHGDRRALEEMRAFVTRRDDYCRRMGIPLYEPGQAEPERYQSLQKLPEGIPQGFARLLECGGETHTVVVLYGPDGVLEVLCSEHPDLGAEDALVSLGGDESACGRYARSLQCIAAPRSGPEQ